MHICFLCNEYPPGRHGGIGSFTQMLARSLVARGHSATVVGFYKIAAKREEDDCGVRVIRLAHSQIPLTGFVIHGNKLRSTLLRVHKETPFDVLEGPELSMAMIPENLPTAKLIRMHGGHHFFHVTLGKKPRAWRSWLEHRSFARADYLCAVSHFVAGTTRELLKLGNRPIEVLPNPIDLSRFNPSPNQTEDEGLIIFVGTICEKKGVRQLVEAMPQVLAAVPHARLWIIGRDSIEPHTKQSFTEMLQGQIDSKHAANIVFKGAVDNTEMPALLAKAQLCVYPSHMEAMPLAWLEGMAMGKAVVASQTGPGAEAIENNVSGLLCDPHDASSIAENIIAVLRDDNLRRRLGKQAHLRVREHFSSETIVEQNIAFYRRMSANGNK